MQDRDRGRLQDWLLPSEREQETSERQGRSFSTEQVPFVFRVIRLGNSRPTNKITSRWGSE